MAFPWAVQRNLSHPLSFFLFFFNLVIFRCAGSSLLCEAFSSCTKQGLLSVCGAQACHCGGFSCCRVWAPGHTGFSSCGSQA